MIAPALAALAVLLGWAARAETIRAWPDDLQFGSIGLIILALASAFFAGWFA